MLIIPENIFIGFKSGSDMNIGIMTPDGHDSKSKIKKSRVIRDSGDIPQTTFHNNPMNGFKIRDIRISDDFVSWFVQDPRGFKIPVSSSNILDIIKNTSMENGEILDDCQWGYDNSPYLICDSSNVKAVALENTKRSNTKVSLKDVHIGNKIQLVDGTEVQYMGHWFPVTSTPFNKDTLNRSYGKRDKKRHFIILDKNDKKSVKIVSTLHVSKILNENILTRKDCLVELNNLLSNGDKVYDYKNYDITGASVTSHNDITVSRELVDVTDDLKKILNGGNSDKYPYKNFIVKTPIDEYLFSTTSDSSNYYIDMWKNDPSRFSRIKAFNRLNGHSLETYSLKKPTSSWSNNDTYMESSAEIDTVEKVFLLKITAIMDEGQDSEYRFIN